jgi:hypothetical protein
MNKKFIEYSFETDTVDYTLTYDSSKLNIGHLMSCFTSSNGDRYVSPIETRFIRGFEIGNSTTFQINVMGFLKYNQEISWLFYTNGNAIGSIAKRIFLSTYNKLTNEIEEIGSISVNYTSNAGHKCSSLVPSLEFHNSGSVSVTGTSVIGVGTNWQTNGVCSGNRIGFGSTQSNNINTWYQISNVLSNTNLTITKEYITDGSTLVLSFTSGTPYVIEDLRIIYSNDTTSGPSVRGISLVKGLRLENFTTSPTNIPAGTTVDNLRASYRILDNNSTNAVFQPVGLILENKNSFSEQFLFSLSQDSSNLSIQKFNIRSNLGLTAGISSTPFVLKTSSVAHGGGSFILYNPFIKGANNDYYVNLLNKITRIIPNNIASASTTFIGDEMSESVPGTTTTFALSSQLQGFHYLPLIDRFYISHEQGTIKNYLTKYSPVGNQFERAFNLNDRMQSNTYVVSTIDTLKNNFLSLPLRSYYHDGLSYIIRDTNTNNNLVYTLPIEADKRYHTASKACVVTPEIYTPGNYSYDKVYLRKKSSFNSTKFLHSTENVDVYFRNNGISSDTGTWTLVSENGDISYATGSSIQFKITFSTVGINSISDKVFSIALSYFSQELPNPNPFFEPSLKFTNISSESFSWRQIQQLSQLTELNIDVYNNSNNTLILSDSTISQSNGIWEYSTNSGLSWGTTSVNQIGSFIRYTPSVSLGSGLTVRPIIYISTTQSYVSIAPTSEPEELDYDAELFIQVSGITDTNLKNLSNQLVIDLKNNNLWTKMRIIYPFFGASSSTQKYNLKDPYSNQLGFAGGWTHDDKGAESNGINAYGNPSFTISSLGVTDWSMGFYVNSTASTTGHVFASSNNNFSDYLGFVQSPTTTMRAYLGRNIGSSLATTVDTNTQQGFWALSANLTNRSLLTSTGSFLTASISNAIGYDGTPILLAAITGGQGLGFLQGYQRNRFAFAYISRGLSDSEMTTLSNIVHNLQIILNRNA